MSPSPASVFRLTSLRVTRSRSQITMLQCEEGLVIYCRVDRGASLSRTGTRGECFRRPDTFSLLLDRFLTGGGKASIWPMHCIPQDFLSRRMGNEWRMNFPVGNGGPLRLRLPRQPRVQEREIHHPPDGHRQSEGVSAKGLGSASTRKQAMPWYAGI